jgi:hypothetical protein
MRDGVLISAAWAAVLSAATMANAKAVTGAMGERMRLSSLSG